MHKPWLQERVKKLKKDHGSVELGKITADMVFILHVS
jgi:citrate synthase